MGQGFRILVLVFTGTLIAFGQDQPSLGDAARQARQQKQQKGAQVKEGQSKDTQPAKAQKVVTNDEIPEHPPVTAFHRSADEPHGAGYSSPHSGEWKMPAEQWKAQILAQKNMIAAMQNGISRLKDSIHFVDCAGNCPQWNERQREKQQQVERMQAQLQDLQKRLEELQESARRQGYGSSVYDP